MGGFCVLLLEWGYILVLVLCFKEPPHRQTHKKHIKEAVESQFCSIIRTNFITLYITFRVSDFSMPLSATLCMITCSSKNQKGRILDKRPYFEPTSQAFPKTKPFVQKRGQTGSGILYILQNYHYTTLVSRVWPRLRPKNTPLRNAKCFERNKHASGIARISNVTRKACTDII